MSDIERPEVTYMLELDTTERLTLARVIDEWLTTNEEPYDSHLEGIAVQLLNPHLTEWGRA